MTPTVTSQLLPGWQIFSSNLVRRTTSISVNSKVPKSVSSSSYPARRKSRMASVTREPASPTSPSAVKVVISPKGTMNGTGLKTHVIGSVVSSHWPQGSTFTFDDVDATAIVLRKDGRGDDKDLDSAAKAAPTDPAHAHRRRIQQVLKTKMNGNVAIDSAGAVSFVEKTHLRNGVRSDGGGSLSDGYANHECINQNENGSDSNRHSVLVSTALVKMTSKEEEGDLESGKVKKRRRLPDHTEIERQQNDGTSSLVDASAAAVTERVLSPFEYKKFDVKAILRKCDVIASEDIRRENGRPAIPGPIHQVNDLDATNNRLLGQRDVLTVTDGKKPASCCGGTLRKKDGPVHKEVLTHLAGDPSHEDKTSRSGQSPSNIYVRPTKSTVMMVRKTVVKRIVVKKSSTGSSRGSGLRRDGGGQELNRNATKTGLASRMPRTHVEVTTPSGAVSKPPLSDGKSGMSERKPRSSSATKSPASRPSSASVEKRGVKGSPSNTGERISGESVTDKGRKSDGRQMLSLSASSSSSSLKPASSPQRRSSKETVDKSSRMAAKDVVKKSSTFTGGPGRVSSARLQKRNSMPSLPTWVPAGRKASAPMHLLPPPGRRKSVTATVLDRKKMADIAKKRSLPRKLENAALRALSVKTECQPAPGKKVKSSERNLSEKAAPSGSRPSSSEKKGRTLDSRPQSGKKSTSDGKVNSRPSSRPSSARKTGVSYSEPGSVLLRRAEKKQQESVVKKKKDSGCVEKGKAKKSDVTVIVSGNQEKKSGNEKAKLLGECDVQTLRDQAAAAAAAAPGENCTRLSDSDLQHMRDSAVSPSSSPFGDAKRRVMPKVRRRPSTNPVRQLKSRDDVKSEEISTSNRRWSSLGFGSQTRLSVIRDGAVVDLHESALAGLASKEDFKSVILKKTRKAADGTAIDEEKEDLLTQPSLVVVQIKGRRRVQVRLAEPSYKSLNSNDVFIVFTPTELYHWVGSQANVIEKAKGVDLASRIIQKKDMGCKARCAFLIEQKKSMSGIKMNGLRQVLGANGETNIAGGSDIPTDEAFEKTCVESVMIYAVKEDSDKLAPITELCGKQPKYNLLETKFAFVFDFVNEVYVWIGRTALGVLRRKAMKFGKELFDSGYQCLPRSKLSPKNGSKRKHPRPEWALFARMSEGTETFLFKEKFPDWPEPGRIIKMKGHVSSGDVQPASPALELVPCSGEDMYRSPSPLANCILEGENIGRGRGVPPTEDKPGVSVATADIKIWHVKENTYSEVPDSERGLFYSEEGYIIRWGYRVFKEFPKRKMRVFRHRTMHEFGGKEKCCYFFWHGDNCSITEKGASALLTVELDEEKGPQIRVPQGKEPPAFLQLFGGGLVILNGKRPEGDGSLQAEKRVFCVQGSVAHEAHLIEVPQPAGGSALRSRSCMVSVSSSSVMIWKGSKATEEIDLVASAAAKKLQKRLSLDLETFVEGEERLRFWRSLGGGRDYHSLKDESAKYQFTPRLFELSRAPGPFSYEEILSPSRLPKSVCPFPFLQNDMYLSQQPGLFLVDAHYEVYLWLGWWRPEGDESNVLTGSSRSRWLKDKELAMKTAVNYAAVKGEGCPVYVVAAGREPLEFTSLFPCWTHNAEAKERSAHGYKGPPARLPVEEELAKLNRKYSQKELQCRPPPDGVDLLRLETYLSAEEFVSVFKMGIEEFNKLPQWKQVTAKKAAGLF